MGKIRAKITRKSHIHAASRSIAQACCLSAMSLSCGHASAAAVASAHCSHTYIPAADTGSTRRNCAIVQFRAPASAARAA